jgi:hypothetical protein
MAMQGRDRDAETLFEVPERAAASQRGFNVDALGMMLD